MGEDYAVVATAVQQLFLWQDLIIRHSCEGRNPSDFEMDPCLRRGDEVILAFAGVTKCSEWQGLVIRHSCEGRNPSDSEMGPWLRREDRSVEREVLLCP